MSQGIGSFDELLKKAQSLQSKMAKVQEEVQKRTVEASAGGGMVTVVANGKLEILSVKIDPSVMEDREMVEDLVVAATNEALRQAQKLMAEEIGKLTGGMPIPGMGG